MIDLGKLSWFLEYNLLHAHAHWDNKDGHVTRIIKKSLVLDLSEKINKKKSKGRELLLKALVKTREDNQ